MSDSQLTQSEADTIRNKSWMSTNEDEEILWWENPSIIPKIPEFLAGFSFIPISIAVYYYLPEIGIEAFALVPFSILLMGLTYLRIITTHYVITTQRVTYKYGILSPQDMTDVKYDKIQHIRINQSFIEKKLGYGNLSVATAGTGVEEKIFSNAPNPNKANEILQQAKQDYNTES